MSDDASQPTTAGRRARSRRLVRLLVAVDVVVLLAALGAWLALRGDGDERANSVNEGLRGSRPPAGQLLPQPRGLEPPLPGREQLRGSPVAIVATCLDCRSGDIIGGFLGRLERDDLQDGARLHLVGWDGDVEAWAREWRIDADRVELHAASDPRSADAARRAFGIGAVDGAEESGAAYLYDTRGRWRATYFLGQLDADDIAYDLRVLSRP